MPILQTKKNNYIKKLLYVLLLAIFTLPVHSPVWAAKSFADQESELMARYDFLEKNEKEGRLRHAWERLERQFRQLSGKSKSDIKSNSLFYAAKSRHSLAKRSFTNDDYRKALKNYADFYKAYPKSNLSAAALYASAEIQAFRFKNNNEAKKLAQQLIKEFPKSDEFRSATLFLEKLDSKPSQEKKDQSSPVAKSFKSSSKSQRAAQLGLTVETIMIDAGHGGKDPGAEGNGISEYSLTLKMANILSKELRSRGFTVLLTRTNNNFIALGKRTEMGNEKKADLFISIHANSNKDSKLHGLESYYLDSTSSARAKKVAARENAVSESQLSDVQFILTDLMLNSKLKESRALARVVHRGILSELQKGKYKYHDNGVRPGPFYVLMGARMPAVLIEMGYLSNSLDAKLLKNDEFLARQARGIADGILVYRKEVAKGFE